MWAWLFAAAAVSTCCRWANKLNENFVYCNNYPSSAGNCLRWLLVSFAPEYRALSGWGLSPLWKDYLPKCTDFPWKWTDIIRQALALAFHYVLSLVCGETTSKAPTSCDSMEMWAGSRTIRRACVGNSHRASVCVPGIRSKKALLASTLSNGTHCRHRYAKKVLANSAYACCVLRAQGTNHESTLETHFYAKVLRMSSEYGALGLKKVCWAMQIGCTASVKSLLT